MNLLKSGENQGFTEFCNYMCSNDFVPQISIPTRFDIKSCSLIDHIWTHRPCNSNLDTLSSASSAVILQRFGRTDHNTVTVFLNIESKKNHPPKYILVEKNDEDSIDKFRNDLRNKDIISQIDNAPTACPEQNYRIMSDIISGCIADNFPIKRVKFNRHKHNHG